MQSEKVSSGFDSHNPPQPKLIDQCVHCGFCLATCPTYSLWGEEMDSPRGRIYLMKMVSEGKATMNDKFVQHIDACLGCVACMPACPSGVQYGRLVEATRAQIERNFKRPFLDRLVRWLVLNLFPYPGRLKVMAVPLVLYQGLGIRALMRRTGLLKALPSKLQSMEGLLPERIANATIPSGKPDGTPRRRVGLMLGCVQRVFFSQVNAATARVLLAEGCEVVVPDSQGCCGALMVHVGEEERALQHARELIDSFPVQELDAILINAAGCGSNVKEFGYLLRHDAKYAERAKAFAAKCKDITEFLAELKPLAKRNPINLKVAYQDACHLQHAQGVRLQPRKLLSDIPGVELKEIPEAAICCGSAGIYNVIQPEPAAELGERKARNISDLNVEAVVTGNPGCLLQLKSSLERMGRATPVLHTVEILDASISGTSISQ